MFWKRKFFHYYFAEILTDFCDIYAEICYTYNKSKIDEYAL